MNKINFFTKLLGLFLFFPVFVSLEMKAEEVNPSDIQKVAINAFSLYSGISKNELTITQIIPVTQQDTAFFYIFNFDKGFIIVAADNVSIPIIGYDLENTIVMNDIPPAVSFLFDGYKEEIGVAKRMRPETSREILRQWEELLDDERGGASGESGQTGVIVGNNKEEEATPIYYKPGTWLMETKWNQSGGNTTGGGATYNYYCPTISGTKTLVGCGGVAFAQILNYYSCHVTPKGTLTHTQTGLPTITINLSSVSYDWSNMAPYQANYYNAQLLYHSAVAIKSNFGVNNTASTITYVQPAFFHNFGFSDNALRFERKHFSDTDWKGFLKNSIDGRRPVYYRGTNIDSTVRHAWVVDGYNNSDQFHCNWGWGGSCDGFYTLTNLTNIDGNNYNYNQVAIVFIRPEKTPHSFYNYTFPCSTATFYSFQLLDCKVAPNVPLGAILNMQCTTEIFGTFEVPLGSAFEIRIP